MPATPTTRTTPATRRPRTISPTASAASCPTLDFAGPAAHRADRLHRRRPRLRAAQQRRQELTVEPWAIELWNRIHADPTTLDYFDFRFGDVHALTLDGRRYADPVIEPNSQRKTKLGFQQLDWMRTVMRESDAAMFVVFSADSFALRENPRRPPGPKARVIDCFQAGWPADYRRIISFYMDLQLEGRRVVILSGDAHGLRVHYHPDPAGRAAAARLSIVEMICSGLRPRLWSGAVPTDPSLDHRRYVLNHPGAGMIEIDPPATPVAGVTMRAINARAADPPDAFPPLRVSFAPGDDRAAGRVV